MVLLERVKLAVIDDGHLRLELLADGLEDVPGLRRHVYASRFHREEAISPVLQEEVRVPEEYLHLVALRDILEEPVSRAYPLREPVDVEGVFEYGYDVAPLLGQEQHVAHHDGGDIDREDHAFLADDVRDVAHRGAGGAAEIQDGASFPHADALRPLEDVRCQLALARVPFAEFPPRGGNEHLPVDRGPGNSVQRVEPALPPVLGLVDFKDS